MFVGIFKALKQKAKEQGPISTETETTENPTDRNPFLQESESQKYSKLDVAMDALTAFTVKRNLSKKP